MHSILITVNTWNRMPLTYRSMNSLFAHKHRDSAVMVVDDQSVDYSPLFFLQNWPIRHMLTTPAHMGIGKAQRFTLQAFLATTYDFWISTQNDVLFSPQFDLKMRQMLLTPRAESVCVSGYRSCKLRFIDTATPEYGRTTFAGGVCVMIDRATAWRLLTEVPEDKWNDRHDCNASSFFKEIRVPWKSLVEHIGAFTPDAVHPMSDDVAVDYVGSSESTCLFRRQ